MILASASPRRKELLSLLGFCFEICPSGVDEFSEHRSPDLYVKDLAKLKGKDILQRQDGPNIIVIAADTVVSLSDQILEKPKDIAEAEQMLSQLSGKVHQVYTGVWLGKKSSEETLSFSCKTEVRFRKIPNDLLQRYLDTEDSLDKAGAYGIQSGALSFIDSIDGCYANVVGLPLSEVDQKLREYLGSDYQKLKKN